MVYNSDEASCDHNVYPLKWTKNLVLYLNKIFFFQI